MGLTACVDSNDNHKAVAARQVRDGEDETELIIDIYAKVKYNRPEQLAAVVNTAFAHVN